MRRQRQAAFSVAYTALLAALSLVILYGSCLVPTGRAGVVGLAGLLPAAAVISGGQAIQQPGKHQERRQPQQQKAGKPDAQAPDEHQKQAENGAARRPDQPGLSSSAAPVDIVPVQGPLFSPLPLH